MEALALKHPHRIDAIVTSLKNQRLALLDVFNALNKQFEALANQYSVSIETIWDVCYCARYDIGSIKGSSKHEQLVNKTPAEALTGKAHKPWLEMLGFTP